MMTTFKILQVFVLSYTGFVALFTIISFILELRFGLQGGKQHLFAWLNKLHGKNTILLPFRILSVLFIFSWLALALPLIDLFIGTDMIASYTHDTAGWAGMKTWFGTFTDQNNAGGYYFMTVFVSILGVKGFWLLKKMADILGNDQLVARHGIWGGRKEFS